MKPVAVLVAVGALLVLAGIAAVPLPGPGWMITSVGVITLAVAGVLALASKSTAKGGPRPK